jgi:acetoin utilization deacetylase AcuC-like enzyme
MEYTTGVFFDEQCLRHVIYYGHPEAPKRLKSIRETMDDSGLVKAVAWLAPPPGADPLPYILKVHTADHVRSIQKTPITGPVAQLAVACALGAVQAVSAGKLKNAFCAVRPPGHHALNTGAEEGFCYYNNTAIAARYAQEVCGHKKVLIIDWDYHHGNGTEQVFYEDPTVLFFSTHNWHDYPGTGDPARAGAGPGLGYTINVHLDPGATDADMLRAWEEKLLPAAAAFQPDFVIISAGFDSREDDLLGRFRITDDCFGKMTDLALGIARQHAQGRLVSILEGGYNVKGLARAVGVHVRRLIES